MRASSHRVDWLLALGLAAVAFVMRLPYLYLVPLYADEGLEVLWGLGIARGQHFPLTGYDPYYGPVYYYLIAALLRAVGVNPWLPRLLSAVLGALVAAAAFWLGRVMGSRASGFIAAALTATNTTLIVWSSHYAWSNSLTPLLATAAFATFYRGVAQQRDRWLIASGLLAALAVQTHPLALVGAVGMALWFLSQPSQRARLSQPAPYLAAALFVLGSLPVLFANAQDASKLVIASQTRNYAFAPTIMPNVYFERMGELLTRLGLSSGYWLGSGNALAWVTVIAGAGLTLVGVLWLWRHGNSFPLWVLGTAILLLPIVLKVYSEPFVRYLTFLLPLGFAALAILVSRAAARSSPGLSPRVRVAAGLMLLLGLLTVSGLMLAANYTMLTRRNETNADYYALNNLLRADNACGGNLYIDQLAPQEANASFRRLATWLGITYTLTLDQCAYHGAHPAELAKEIQQSGSAGWLIAPAVDAALYGAQFKLAHIRLPNENRSPLVPYELFRISPKPPAGSPSSRCSAGCGPTKLPNGLVPRLARL